MKLFFIFLVIVIFNMACIKEGPEISNFDASSHNEGESCSECHNQLKVCGTVFDISETKTKSKVLVKFATTNDATGLIKTSIEVDENGNFYTNNDVEYLGLYPFVVYPDGTKAQYMQSSVNSGDCNTCHQQGNRIWIE